MQHKVLIVTNLKPPAEPTSRSLRKAGFAVATITYKDFNPDEVERLDPDIVLVDFANAASEVPPLCRQIRAVSNAGVVVLASQCETKDRISGLDAGADDYLCRPLDTTELAARFRALIRRRRESTGAGPVRVGDLVIDPTGGCVTLGNRVTSLTPRELQLLLVLVEKPGQPVARESIQRRIWQTPWVRQSDPVKVYVAYLRRKLASLGLRDAIQTMRGFGYALRIPPSFTIADAANNLSE